VDYPGLQRKKSATQGWQIATASIDPQHIPELHPAARGMLADKSEINKQ